LRLVTFVQCASAKVEAKIWFSANGLTPFHELIGAKLVGLGAYPCKLWSLRYNLVHVLH
jgi:hypothetical protein